jgi:hypothetical protein
MQPDMRIALRATILAGAMLATAGALLPAAAESAPKAGGKVKITYDGKIGRGTAPGHATFVAKGAIADTGTLVILGRDTGPIVYTKLTFRGKKGTFRINEKIIKGGFHTWTMISGTNAYAGLHAHGTETGRPDFSTLRIHVVMVGVVTKTLAVVYTTSTAAALAPASATAWTALHGKVTVRCTMTLKSRPITDGTLSGSGRCVISGAINDSGAVKDYRTQTGANVKLRRVVVGKNGTITFLITINLATGSEPWTIRSGTKAYKGLHGKGSQVVDSYATKPALFVLKGTVTSSQAA